MNPIIVILCGQFVFPSSVVWAQASPQDPTAPDPEALTEFVDPEGALGGNWSWQAARTHFWLALTSKEPGTRERLWAHTFRALGQQMHLVVDASVPEHVRSDPHLLEAILKSVGLSGYGSYEYWVSGAHTGQGSSSEPNFIAAYLSKPAPVDAGVLQQGTGDPSVPVPVARLIDTRRYKGTDPNITLGGPIGIAEVANANFFSEDTGGGQYRYPDVELLVPSEYMVPSASYIRGYYDKGAGDGIAVKPVLAECALDQAALDNGVPFVLLVKCTDKQVWAQVATHMLPRAVGYSAALLDYFFRGELGASFEPPVDGNSGHTVRIVNRSPGEWMQGTFALYYDTTGQRRLQLAEWLMALAPGATTLPLMVPSPAPENPPLEPGRYLVVFKGKLGNEPAAVAAQWVPPFRAYVRVLADDTGRCIRQPSNQYGECIQVSSATTRVVDVGDGGVTEFAGPDTWTYAWNYRLVAPGNYPGDATWTLYVNEIQDAYRRLYVYREVGGPTLRITAIPSGNALAYACAVAWGPLVGSVEALLTATYWHPPNYDARGSAILSSGTTTLPVGLGPLVVYVGSAAGLPFPLVEPVDNTARCDVTSLQFVE